MARSLGSWLGYIEQQHPKSIELGLERTREVARRLAIGKPAVNVITVGGTNGKGSTVTLIEAIARAAGLKVGTYTSPHLVRYNERVRIDGREAGDEELVAAFEAVESARGAVPLTYFEFGTLAALWLFQQRPLDLAVLEVGLGGRLDAVNLIDVQVEQTGQQAQRRLGFFQLLGDDIDAEIRAVDRDRLAMTVDQPAATRRNDDQLDAIALGQQFVMLVLGDREIA